MLPSWVESRFLARVASKAPEIVLRVIGSIPETNNSRIHSDYIDAALAMPTELAAKIALKARHWVDSIYAPTFPQRYGALIEHIAKGGNKQPAFLLCESLMGLKEKLLYSKPIDGMKDRKRAVSKFSVWDYEQILQKTFPILDEKYPLDTIKILSRILKQALFIEGDCTNTEGEKDYSYIWRPMIARDEIGYPSDLKIRLLSQLKNTLVRVLQRNADLITEIAEVLNGESTPLHLRVALFAFTLVPDKIQYSKIVHLEDKRFISDQTYWREYATLLKHNLAALTLEQKNCILSVIDSGPEENISDDADEREHFAQFARYWKFERYAVVKDLLDVERKVFFDSLTAEFGTPEDLEAPTQRFESWVGPTSPLDEEQLGKLSTDEIIDYLEKWIPTKDHFSPSPNGLGRLLSNLVKDRVSEFVERLAKFKSLNKTYARSVLEGISMSLEKTLFDWDKVLHFVDWIVNKEIDIVTLRKAESYDEDTHWAWTKQSIARLIHSSLQLRGEYEVPFAKREIIWGIISTLSWNDNPTIERDGEYTKSGRDYYQFSINTIRGEALHTVVAYALWVKHHFKSQNVDADFTCMPEVRQNLDAHLEVEKEPTATVRSVYGRWLPWLYYIDAEWTIDNLNKIFPKDNPLFLDAAWSTFVTWTHPYSDIYKILECQYETAVLGLGNTREGNETSHSPEMKLAEHLMGLYWNENSGITINSKIITDFFSIASTKVKQHAITSLGRWLATPNELISNETLEKLKRLFLWRLHTNQTNANLDPKEIEDFGWWLVSKRFSTVWMFSIAEEVLILCKSIDPLFMVVEVAKAEYENHPDLILQFITRLIETAPLSNDFYSWPDDVEVILKSAIKNGGSRKKTAQDIAQKLIAMGFKNFREVLK
jgi:hypothetical protein